MRTLACAAFAAAIAAASSAHAVIAPFGGPAFGVDPLGHAWTTSNAFKPAWGEPGLGAGTLVFNPGAISNGAGTWANRFAFIYLEGVGGAIDQAPPAGFGGFELTTRFSDVTKGALWVRTFFGSNKVVFTAPHGTRIDAGDLFFLNITFKGPVDLTRYSFAGLWSDDAAIPEPATWSLMIGGFALAGAALRRRARKVGA